MQEVEQRRSSCREGRGEENKNKDNALFDPLILTFSRWEKGLVS